MHSVTIKLVPANLDRVHAALVRAGVGHPEQPFERPFELLAAIEELAKTLASARLSLALEQGARDGLRQLARQAEEVRRRPGCASCTLGHQVVLAAHQTFGERG